ncbi:type 2 isopentenyl-diphosphate Delta-isomerase [Peribacillus cavernae]|uniref:Isopentenyl-diphosphate delta-isomerase n=1 Tax=Peribacillus cavernae TaxID=1674310 RepID=A0A3S0U375_9BACI|nr:type 2 isopentenyl-diphosphate Delta-isomerase [Peribacillus cavernae]MDQ0219003.1 isopentenyl-diphosphate delta-isomerase [Peribacillus cavernae]RUQ29291.1 type 2 isopentenyl-diphosphate Delta-isomerase [Peribacillus cavernae]
MTRTQRKLEHIHYALQTGQHRLSGFEDISFVHQSLPDLSTEGISLDTAIGGLHASSPIFINAMTGGGGKETENLNRDLAMAAKETGISMAVGSQMAAIKDPAQAASFEIVRKMNPDGIVIANLGGEAGIEEAKRAADMLKADALQIHLNVIQELTMPEGDRTFEGVLARIEEIRLKLDIPVIVKETGFGMSKETVAQLCSAGISILDVGGFGGTNFARIENERRQTALTLFNDWGIPTAVSIAEAVSAGEDTSILASGGIQDALDVAKCIALGADGAGIAGHFMKSLKEKGMTALIHEIEDLHQELRIIMTALGAKNIKELQDSSLVISGKTYHWLTQRGIDCSRYAK